MRPTRIASPKFQNLALALEMGTATYLGYEFFRIYKGTHPAMSRKLAEAGVWPLPRLPAVKEGERREGEEKKDVDVRWLHINGVPVPASFDALTGFWRRG